MTTITKGKLPQGVKVHLGGHAHWAGIYEAQEVLKFHVNGKIAVRFSFRGKSKVFHIPQDSLTKAIAETT